MLHSVTLKHSFLAYVFSVRMATNRSRDAAKVLNHNILYRVAVACTIFLTIVSLLLFIYYNSLGTILL